MANNRMYLICLHCLYDDGITELEACRCYFAKYYPPPTGWYTSMEPEVHTKRLNEFFEAHQHKETWQQAMYGDHFTLGTETIMRDGMTEGKRGVLEAVARAASEGKVGQ